MTPNKVIENVDRVKVNTYGEEDKLRWISELDGIVHRLVFLELEAEPYKYPDDMYTELVIPSPFDNVYALYIEAMIDFHNREYDHYNNAMQMFYSRFDDYRKAYIRENKPAPSGGFKL